VHCPFVRSVGALQSLVAGRVVDATRLLVVLQYLCVPKYFLVDVMILSVEKSGGLSKLSDTNNPVIAGSS